jgi:hypothetical protein
LKFNEALILNKQGSNNNIQNSTEPGSITILRIPSLGGATSSDSDEDSPEPKTTLQKEIIYEKGALPDIPDRGSPLRPTQPQTSNTGNPVSSNVRPTHKNHSLILPGRDSPDCTESFSIYTPTKSLINFKSSQRKGIIPSLTKVCSPTQDDLERRDSTESYTEAHDTPDFRELVKLRENSLLAGEALRGPPDNLESTKRNETKSSLNFYDDCSPIAEVEEELSNEHSTDRVVPDPGNVTIGKRRGSDLLDTSKVSKNNIHPGSYLLALGMALPEITGNGLSSNKGKLGNSPVKN